MPQVQGVDDELRLEYFNSYVDTYLMRDATEAGGIGLAGRSVRSDGPIWFSVLPPGGMASVPQPLHFQAEPAYSPAVQHTLKG